METGQLGQRRQQEGNDLIHESMFKRCENIDGLGYTTNIIRKCN